MVDCDSGGPRNDGRTIDDDFGRINSNGLTANNDGFYRLRLYLSVAAADLQ